MRMSVDEALASGQRSNPLGVIGLFVVLVYGLASITFAFQSELSTGQRWVLTVFIVVFPVVVFVVFLYILLAKSKLLWAPYDFRTDESFMVVAGYSATPINPSSQPKSLAPVLDGRNKDSNVGHDVLPAVKFQPDELDNILLAVYGSQRGVFVGHVASRSKAKGRDFDVAIFLTEAKLGPEGGLKHVVGASFYLGSGWTRKLIPAEQMDNGRLGIVVRAVGGFLALCQVTFDDGKSVPLSHFCNLDGAALASGFNT